jgi:hypothetical protein
MAIVRAVISSAGGSPSMEGRSLAWGREGGLTVDLHGEAAAAVFTCVRRSDGVSCLIDESMKLSTI